MILGEGNTGLVVACLLQAWALAEVHGTETLLAEQVHASLCFSWK